jgi:predicted phage-related endonuclease
MSDRFKDCEINMCEQRTEPWYEARKGILTASTLGAWIMDTKGGVVATAAREAAICKLVAETAGAWSPKVFETDAMTRGTELEPQAVASFEKATGKTVTPVGFCLSIHGLFGCSPDGLIMEDGTGLEGKVPIPATHILYRRANVLPSAYRLQVEMSMSVTGASGWHFQAFNPGLAPFRIFVERTKATDDLLGELKRFSDQLESALKEEAEAWQEANDRGDIV